jgi:hypothetical protein
VSVVPLTPSRGDRMEALTRANAVRTGRARLRREVATGRRAIADVISDPPAEARTARVGDVLGWQHRWGRARVTRFLSELRARRVAFVAETRPLKALTPRERRQLAAELRGERTDRARDGRYVGADAELAA